MFFSSTKFVYEESVIWVETREDRMPKNYYEHNKNWTKRAKDEPTALTVYTVAGVCPDKKVQQFVPVPQIIRLPIIKTRICREAHTKSYNWAQNEHEAERGKQIELTA